MADSTGCYATYANHLITYTQSLGKVLGRYGHRCPISLCNHGAALQSSQHDVQEV